MSKIKLSKEVALKNATILAAYLLIVWGFYRFLFQFPEEIEEIFIKPVIWLLPVFVLLRKEKKGLNSIGVTTKNLFPSLYLALGLGVVFVIEALIINYVKYGDLSFAAYLGDKPFLWAFLISIATAISEELSFRGYLFNRVWHALGNEWAANLITSFIWALIHVPITVFIWKLSIVSSLIFLLLTTIFGIGSAFVFPRTKNVSSSVFLHILWEWPIILFR